VSDVWVFDTLLVSNSWVSAQHWFTCWCVYHTGISRSRVHTTRRRVTTRRVPVHGTDRIQVQGRTFPVQTTSRTVPGQATGGTGPVQAQSRGGRVTASGAASSSPGDRRRGSSRETPARASPECVVTPSIVHHRVSTCSIHA